MLSRIHSKHGWEASFEEHHGLFSLPIRRCWSASSTFCVTLYFQTASKYQPMSVASATTVTEFPCVANRSASEMISVSASPWLWISKWPSASRKLHKIFANWFLFLSFDKNASSWTDTCKTSSIWMLAGVRAAFLWCSWSFIDGPAF